MQERYGVGITRTQKEPYCFPMTLKQIDELTTTKSKQEILEIIRKNDSTILETNAERVTIFQFQKNRWKISNISYIDSDHQYILSFSMTELFKKEREKKVLNILYNHFSSFLEKKFVSNTMKETIKQMKTNSQDFLKSFEQLDYIEKRFIRDYLASKFDVTSLSKEKHPITTKISDLQNEPIIIEDYKLAKKKAS